MRGMTPLPPAAKRELVAQTQWLRPYTRWATRVSLNAPRWLPTVIRNAPLKLTGWILRSYLKDLR